MMTKEKLPARRAIKKSTREERHIRVTHLYIRGGQ